MKDPIPFGRYQLLERLEVGGTAEVFLARAPDGSLLAVKRPLPTLAERPGLLELFLAEARAGAALAHRAIVRVLEVGRAETGWFLAMEWVPGRDLASLQARLAEAGHRLPPSLAAFVAGEICDALEHAHGRRAAGGHPLGLVHRDLSPRNVLCRWDGAVKLADFGLAGAAWSRPPGRARFLSPEEAAGGEPGPRSDVFALGAVLHEALAGERFGPSAAGVPPSRSNPSVPPGLDAAVLGALRADLATRTPSAAAFGAALRPFADPHGARSLARLLGDLFPEERRRDRERGAPVGVGE